MKSVTDTQPTLNHDHWSTPDIVLPTSENKLIYRTSSFNTCIKKTPIETTTKAMLIIIVQKNLFQSKLKLGLLNPQADNPLFCLLELQISVKRILYEPVDEFPTTWSV